MEFQRTRVALFSRQALVIEGLAAACSRTQDFEFTGAHASIQDICSYMDAQRVDAALLDVSGGMTLRTLTDLHRHTRFCRFALWGNTISAEFACHAMDLGIRGFIPADAPVAELFDDLRTLHAGQLCFPSGLIEGVLLKKRVTVTRREGQLASLLSRGLKNKELATALGITEGTVKVYLSRLFKKLGVNDRFELALYALKNVVYDQFSETGWSGEVEGCGPQSADCGTPRSLVLNRPAHRAATLT